MFLKILNRWVYTSVDCWQHLSSQSSCVLFSLLMTCLLTQIFFRGFP